MVTNFTTFNFVFAGLNLVIAIGLLALSIRCFGQVRTIAAHHERVKRECEELWNTYASKIAHAVETRRNELRSSYSLDQINELRAQYENPTFAGKFYIGTRLLTTAGLDWKRCTIEDGTDSLSYRASVMCGNEQESYYTLVINVRTRDAAIHEVKNYVAKQIISFKPTGLDEPEEIKKEREDFREAFFVSACTAVNTLSAI